MYIGTRFVITCNVICPLHPSFVFKHRQDICDSILLVKSLLDFFSPVLHLLLWWFWRHNLVKLRDNCQEVSRVRLTRRWDRAAQIVKRSWVECAKKEQLHTSENTAGDRKEMAQFKISNSIRVRSWSAELSWRTKKNAIIGKRAPTPSFVSSIEHGRGTKLGLERGMAVSFNSVNWTSIENYMLWM